MNTLWVRRHRRCVPVKCTILAGELINIKKVPAEVVNASEYMDSVHPRTWTRLRTVINRIRRSRKEIDSIDIISCEPVMTRRGTWNGFALIFEIESSIEALDHLEVEVQFTRPLSQVTADKLYEEFLSEYTDYLNYKHIEV